MSGPKFKIGQKFSTTFGDVEIAQIDHISFNDSNYYEYKFITLNLPIRLNEKQLKKVILNKSWKKIRTKKNKNEH